MNSDLKPDADESIRFWSNIWDSKVHHRRDSQWLREQGAGKDDRKQEDIAITLEMLHSDGTTSNRTVPFQKLDLFNK